MCAFGGRSPTVLNAVVIAGTAAVTGARGDAAADPQEPPGPAEGCAPAAPEAQHAGTLGGHRTNVERLLSAAASVLLCDSLPPMVVSRPRHSASHLHAFPLVLNAG